MISSKRVYAILSGALCVLFLFSVPAIAQDDEQVFTAVEQMPQLHGDMDSLKNEIQYPPEAYDAGIEGRVFLQFVVNKNGKAQDLNVIRGVGNGLDEEAKRLVTEANFTPGKQRGKLVNVRMSLPITFKLSEHEPAEPKDDLPPPPEEQEEEDNFFISVEDMPELKGGLAGLQQKVQYPEMAQKAGIEGRVIVQFIVNKKGKVEDPRVIRGIGGGCDEEALRVVKEAEFEPGRQRGNPVRVQYSLPITFRAQN